MGAFGDDFSQVSTHRRQIALMAQLGKDAVRIRAIDDLFFWLASAVVERFDVQVMQFWATQPYRTGQVSTELRSMAHQDPTLPQQIVANMHVAEVAGHIINARNTLLLQRLESIFHQHQATLLGRYGLRYCSGYFLSSKALIVPANDRLSSEKLVTPLTAVALLFLRQPPPLEVQRTIEYILKQAIQFSEARGLLLPPTSAQRIPPTPVLRTPGEFQIEPFPQKPPLILDELVPRRKEDASLMSTSNPLTSVSPIADKQARRLYAAVNGHRSVEELRQATHLTPAETYKALQILLVERRIEVYNVRGQLIDGSLLLDNH
ncbi:MAG TPA: hypothetical protein VFA10_01910 [Ktedonobacteraceae bacterium]|nr:hypothetical protein [Ktedonobacteraceae bacterium]